MSSVCNVASAWSCPFCFLRAIIEHTQGFVKFIVSYRILFRHAEPVTSVENQIRKVNWDGLCSSDYCKWHFNEKYRTGGKSNDENS